MINGAKTSEKIILPFKQLNGTWKFTGFTGFASIYAFVPSIDDLIHEISGPDFPTACNYIKK